MDFQIRRSHLPKRRPSKESGPSHGLADAASPFVPGAGSAAADRDHPNRLLSSSSDATIEGLSHALEMRDRETEGHTRRVTEMAVRLARKMGVRDEELTLIQQGALLHDIGKLGIPDTILLKPGALTRAEWQIMKQHPVLAYKILSGIEFLRPALAIPLYHHERWDGSGYPDGLRRDKIPLAARLFAVVDVYDALTSNRPYRSAWSMQRALAYIRARIGHHFDPRAAQAFLELAGEFS